MVLCGGVGGGGVGVANVDDGEVKPVTFSAFNLSDFNHQGWDCTESKNSEGDQTRKS